MADINLFDYATGDGITDDFAGITAAITAARTAGKSLVIPDDPAVSFAHSGAINWAWDHLKVIAQSGGAKFKHTGAGVAHSFNGMTNYPGGQGCAGGVFGGPNRIFLEGNASTTDLALVDNWHFGHMKISGKNATNAILRGQNTGVVGASAVETTFDIHATSNSSGTQTVVPSYGIRMVSPAACVFEKMLIEFVGNVSGTTGVSLVAPYGNLFNGGTIESCLAGGLAMSGGERNTFINVHNEANGVNNGDWTVHNSNNNTFLNCAGAATAAGQYLGGSRNRYINCKFQKVLIPAGSANNTFENPMIIGTFTDQGTGTVLVHPVYI